MSLPSTGRFEAEVMQTRMVFDGQDWTGTGEVFEQFWRAMLARETERQQGTHLDVEHVGRRVLQSVFPGQWSEVSSRVDGWSERIDPQAID